MISLTLDSLSDYFKSKNYNVVHQEETSQLYILLQIQKVDYPLFIRIYKESGLLQLLLFMPTQVKEGCENELARLLHLINREIELPGYGFDESSKAIFYRVMLQSYDGKIAVEQIDNFIKSLDNLCTMFTVPIVAIAQGNTTYSKLMADLEKLSTQK